MSLALFAVHYTIILNPTARNGRAGRKRMALEAALDAAQLDFRLCVTRGAGHAVELARQAAAASGAVVAVGGDGTVQEVSRGLIESEEETALGVIPVGTGNDFARAIGMPKRLRAAVGALAEGRPVRADYGVVRWQEDGAEKAHFFINAVGIGFDACVAEEASAHKRLPGLMAYLVALLRVLRGWDGPPAVVQADGALVYEGPLLLVTAGNGVSSGGGFRLTPDASVTDGKLDVCAVENLPARRVVRLLPYVVRGRHTAFPEVRMRQAEQISVEAGAALALHADGEILTRGTRQVTIRVVPGRLPVLMPKRPRSRQ